jgi:hypothetical protein
VISIDSDPKNLEAIVVLGAISTLLNDDKLLDATLSEIISMPAQERRQLDRLRKVDALLLRHHLIQVLSGCQFNMLITITNYFPPLSCRLFHFPMSCDTFALWCLAGCWLACPLLGEHLFY